MKVLIVEIVSLCSEMFSSSSVSDVDQVEVSTEVGVGQILIMKSTASLGVSQSWAEFQAYKKVVKCG